MATFMSPHDYLAPENIFTARDPRVDPDKQ